MNLDQGSFVAGFLGGVMGGSSVLMTYISVTRYMFKVRNAKMVYLRKQEIARAKHLAALEKAKKKRTGRRSVNQDKKS